MPASLDERLFPVALMMIVTGLVLVIPLILLSNKKLKIREDILFIVFWFQSWIYLCIIPLLNCMFPNSAFAFPSHLVDTRAIRFTIEEVDLYAFFQLLILIFFYFPMLFFYKNNLTRLGGMNPVCSKENCCKISFNRLRNIDNNQPHTSFNRLFILCLFYSLFGVMYSIVAIKGGWLSGYAVNVDIFLAMSQFDRFIWKIYNISAAFILVVLLLAYFERQWSSKFKSILFIVVIAPGVIIEVISHLISSRSAMVLSCITILIVFYIRGHITQSKKRLTLIIVAAAMIVIYSLAVIPNLRGIVLSPNVTSDDILENLNPFSTKDDRLQSDIGARFDGLELMVLATPYLVNQGFVPFSWYAITLINPILPLFPEIEKRMKIDENIADFKQRYLQTYTPAITPDYIAVSFTELFMVMGPLGFLIVGIFYGVILKWTNRLICKNNYYMIGGIFIMFQIFIFELPISLALTGWIRCLPVFLVILIFSPWSKSNVMKVIVNRNSLSN